MCPAWGRFLFEALFPDTPTLMPMVVDESEELSRSIETTVPVASRKVHPYEYHERSDAHRQAFMESLDLETRSINSHCSLMVSKPTTVLGS